VRKEYYFIAALVLFAGIIFGFGSRVGLALQTAIRGGTPTSATQQATDLTASIGLARGEASLKVHVYSQYPLNLKNQLSIAAGSLDGISEGDIALSNGFLVGIVEKVFERSALVQTVFDKRFQAPVRIGASGADALLRGGNDPQLTLIPVNAMISEGDEVYAAADGMPYGAALGSLRSLHDSGDKVFREASLSVPYSAGNMEELTIIPSSKQ
jgi:cell shape-determining protein MreC